MRNTTEQAVEHYLGMVNTIDAWIANNQDLIDREEEDDAELEALQLVRKKTVRIIAFLERKAGV